MVRTPILTAGSPRSGCATVVTFAVDLGRKSVAVHSSLKPIATLETAMLAVELLTAAWVIGDGI